MSFSARKVIKEERDMNVPNFPWLSCSKQTLPTSVFLAIWLAISSLVQTWTNPYFLASILEIFDRLVAGGPTTRILADL